MDGVEEVIRIRIIKFDKPGRAHWPGMYGQPHTGAWAFPIPDLEVGDELVVALEWKLTAWVPKQVVNPCMQRHSADRPPRPSRRVGRLTERDLRRVLGDWNAEKS